MRKESRVAWNPGRKAVQLAIADPNPIQSFAQAMKREYLQLNVVDLVPSVLSML
jgi:hypothetical protein